MPPTRIVLVPGNGCGGDIRACNFYGWAEKAFTENGYEFVLPAEGMPDPVKARECIWIPFIRNNLGADINSVVIGHSSGAAAALRLAESHKLKGIVLVAAYHTDLGDENERQSGYFSRPFNWKAIQSNCDFIIQFAGTADSLVPIHIQRQLAKELQPKCNYYEVNGGDHFFLPPFNQLIQAISIQEGSQNP